jgi:ribosomal protein L16 Arg81 hydroxylase
MRWVIDICARPMSPPDFDLSELLRPVSRTTFFSEYWEKKPLLVNRNCCDYYASLLTLSEVDPLITVFPPESVILANADAPVTLEVVTRADTSAADASLDVIKACQLFNAGATIIVRDAHKRLAPLAALCRTLESEVGAYFKANLYMTPANGRGLDTHYDTHDTILLQAAGSKEWTIYGSPVELPLIGQAFNKNENYQLGNPIMSFVLNAGDFLYIPRGYFHRGRSRNEISLHATVGVWPYLWSNVLLEAVAKLCLSDPAFRRSVPVGLGRSEFDMASARRTFADLLSRVVTQTRVEPIIERLADEFIISRPAFVPGQIKQVALAQELVLDDEVGVRPATIFSLHRAEEMIRVRTHGREILLSAEAGDAVKFALQSERYRVRDLPGFLDDEDKLTIVRRLIEEGLVWRLSGQ